MTVAVPTDGSEPAAAALQAVAPVTAAQATTAALANTPGTATAPVLKSIAGNVVWEVDVTATAGGSSDVVVDAGNAKILDSHVEGGGGRNGGHPGGPDGAAAPAATATTAEARQPPHRTTLPSSTIRWSPLARAGSSAFGAADADGWVGLGVPIRDERGVEPVSREGSTG